MHCFFLLQLLRPDALFYYDTLSTLSVIAARVCILGPMIRGFFVALRIRSWHDFFVECVSCRRLARFRLNMFDWTLLSTRRDQCSLVPTTQCRTNFLVHWIAACMQGFRKGGRAPQLFRFCSTQWVAPTTTRRHRFFDQISVLRSPRNLSERCSTLLTVRVSATCLGFRVSSVHFEEVRVTACQSCLYIGLAQLSMDAVRQEKLELPTKVALVERRLWHSLVVSRVHSLFFFSVANSNAAIPVVRPTYCLELLKKGCSMMAASSNGAVLCR